WAGEVRLVPLLAGKSPLPNGPIRARVKFSRGPGSVVVLAPEVGDEVFTLHPAQRVLQLHQLNEQIVLGIEPRRGHGALEVEAQPLLHTPETGALGEIEEQREIEDERRRQDRVAAEEVHLDLHRVTEPPEDVDVIPTLFFVPAGRIVVD